MTSDPIADMLTRVRNAIVARHPKVDVPASKLKAEVARILKEEGYISEYEVDHSSRPAVIKVTMKFVNRTPALTGVKRISKPGLRKYIGADEVPRVLGGTGTSIVSSSRGILTGQQAKRENIGGELLAIVW